MTGLDPDSDSIIEIYCLVTNGQLELLDESGWGTIVHQTGERMAMMDEWCTRVRKHPYLSLTTPASPAELGSWRRMLTQVDGESGLTTAVIKSTVTPQQAAEGLLAYIKKHVPQRGVALLAGNSVHADQTFLKKEPYKRVLDHLHYRILDVSSIKEAARRWWYVALDLSFHLSSRPPPLRNRHFSGSLGWW